MKKKLLSLMLVGAMAASMVACGGSDTAAETSSDAATEDGAAAADVQSADENTLTVYAWDENFNIPALKAAEKDYQEVNPDFKLEVITQSQSSDVEQAITLAAEAGDYSTLPDIVLFQDHYIQQYVTNYPDAWQDADDADCDWAGLGAEKLSYSTIDGKHYGFPVDAGTAIFAYRTDLLEQAGYTIDDVKGITWDQFDEIGKKVYDATGKYLLCMDGDGNDLFYMMLQEEGVSQFKDGKPYITENETLVKVFDVLVKLAQDNVLYLANDWSDYTDQAIQGDMVAGVFNGNWIIPTMKQVADNSGKWEIVPAPTLTGKPGYASNGGSSLYITGNCTKTDLAKDFLAYTFGGRSAEDGQSITYDEALLNGGVIGTCAAAAESDVYQQGVDFFNGQAIYADIVDYTQNVPTVEQSDYHYACRTQLATALQNVLQNGYDSKQALEEAESNLKFEMGL
ncbi:ABC transporter substrate-binding protein [Pseudobutyrivibrio xylanivorans]|uniref:Lactose/L-arabinose transport system substrate-binding protein n=1 Tax=Pseudobutyrivibrio xylanivorans TaxID=185007 RepID=A0A1G5RYN9_PSEXY|nr:sugar ABC transporter substrate-binding protein [Pseudobutyrivibrio xylanivorans]SCZ78958.1 lactose/L-arabinose transport system substrate-binding protein [Pseudobutyrivibrio xylanivorans]